MVRQRTFKVDYAGTTSGEKSFGNGEAAFSAKMGDVVTELVYDWEPTPKPKEDDSENSASQFETTNNAVLIGYLNWRPDSEGDDKVYDWGLGQTFDTPIDKSRSKDVLSISIDLSSLNSLFARIGSQIDEVLTNFDDQDWEYIRENIDEVVGDINVDTPSEDLTISADDLQRNLGKGLHLFGLNLNKRNDESEEDFQARRQTFEEILQQSDSINSNPNREESPVVSQIRALINRNVFKAKATIMGDPTFGSAIEPMSAYFISNFMAPTYFASYFSGKGWLFSKATHKFGDDGSYKTDLELLGQPDMFIPRSVEATAIEANITSGNRYQAMAASYGVE